MEMWCNDCGARFREQCTCPNQPPLPELKDKWVGIDGHTYIGDIKRPSLGLHADDCRCHTSDDWY